MCDHTSLALLVDTGTLARRARERERGRIRRPTTLIVSRPLRATRAMSLATRTTTTVSSTRARVPPHRATRARDVSTTVFPRSSPHPFIPAFVAVAVLGTAAEASPVTVFAGDYYDPNHPGCPRTIDARGVVSGLDPVPFARGRGCRGVKKANLERTSEKFKKWSVRSKISGNEITIDFNAKDGSGEKVTGKWTGNGIALPDGTTWRKKSDSQAWTPR